LDLKPFWQDYDHYLVTEPTALGHSLADEYPTRFVDHFAFGQARVASRMTLVVSGLKNMWASLRHTLSERPDVVISTGAGSALFTALFGRLTGAKFVLIESFARVRGPSLFGRMAHRFANKVIVQSDALKTGWPNAEVCDPLKILGTGRPEKEPLAFVTVGTVMPFDRLVKGVEALKAQSLLPERVIAQVGDGGYRPEGWEVHERMPFNEVQAILAKADIVFCHGGTGSLVTGCQAGCRVIAIPRDPVRGEHYDNHQEEIVTAFAERGLIQTVTEADQLPAALAVARTQEPIRATTEPDLLISRLRQLVAEWFPESANTGSVAP
jgi:UDP-N-acetylglucosamine transferase subunit ALG13